MFKKTMPILLLIIGFYLITHLFNLTILPVFADESIYIRWAQLIIDDPARYFFFPLNDGKTPLFIWLLAPFQLLFSDQLYAARIVGVLVGGLQVAGIGYLTYLLSDSRKTAWLAALWTIVLPFWYFHHRVALIDGLLAVCLTGILIGLIKLSQVLATKKVAPKVAAGWTIFTGICLGLALLTKIPAVLFLPAMGLFGFWSTKFTSAQRLRFWIYAGVAAVIGLGMFGSLRLSPAFGQLFNRGGDFLYPWREVVLEGAWQQTLPNFPSYISYFVVYLTFPVMLLVVAGLFLKPHQRINHILFWSALGFLFPIMILGKVVYPRYLLPAAVFFTVIAALSLQDIVRLWVFQQSKMIHKMIAGTLIVTIIANSFATSGVFMAYAMLNPNQLPLVSADRVQYLTEWSSGHGIKETVTLIQDKAKTQTLAVATEGYFGTLPDALLMYFHRRNVDNIYIEGIGQPVYTIPQSFVDRAKTYDQVWLVVNSHRLDLQIPPENLVAEFCRPDQAPCLQVWNITDLVKQ